MIVDTDTQTEAIIGEASEAPPPATAPAVPLLNREASWLAFNERVIEEAENVAHPLLERLKFLAISESNLDEFFMIRVSGIREQLSADVTEVSDDGLSPAEQLEGIRRTVKRMVARQGRCLAEDLIPKLAEAGIRIWAVSALDDDRRAAAREYFRKSVFPILTPLAVDPGHPFPFLSNLSLNLAVEMREGEGGPIRFARIKVPATLPRLVSLRQITSGKKKVHPEHADYVFLEDLIRAHVDELFPGMTVVSSHLFRVTRDADIEIQEDEAGDLLATIEHEVRQRRFGVVVRLEVAPKIPKRIRKILLKQLQIQDDDVFEVVGPLGAADLAVLNRLERKELKDAPFTASSPIALARRDIFEALREGDLLLHHPYDSFSPVLEFIERASEDPKVLAIKMTLYRTSADSPFIAALIRASELGKQVAVLVELKARFDEQNNIVWARALEQAGVHVVYGVVGLKTHANIALVVRREKDEIRRYVHLGTGNYNPATARIYTDVSLLTSRPEFGDDATDLFNALTGYSRQTSYRKLAVAPHDLHRKTLEWIRRERQNALDGKPSGIRAKLNSLVDPAVIGALYEASQAGVPIDLLVRGVCCLVPGAPGISENIRVISIVGRFLEHSRIFIFENGGNPEVQLSSADWMQRNFFRRVEVAFPVVDPELARQVREEIFEPSARDTSHARRLTETGAYVSLKPEAENGFDSQEHFIEQARKRTLRSIEALRRGSLGEDEGLEPVRPPASDNDPPADWRP